MLTARVSIRVPSPAQTKRLQKQPFSMCYYVYILYSSKLDSYYKGQTKDLTGRLNRHNQGYEKSTGRGVPWTLVWYRVAGSRSEAMLLEKKLKNMSRERLKRFMETHPGDNFSTGSSV